MKIVKLLGILLLFLFCQCTDNLIVDSKIVANKSACLPDVKDRYIYPEFQGDEFSSQQEVLQFCQMPKSIFKSLSTATLIRGLLDMPILNSLYMQSSNSSPIGKSYSIYAVHNSVTELEIRKDITDVLYEFYKNTCFDCLADKDDIQKMTICTQITVLQSLFTRQSILDKYDSQWKKTIVRLFLDKYEQFQNEGILEVIVWIMYNDAYEPVTNMYGPTFDKEWLSVSTDAINDVILFAHNYTH